MNLSDYVGGSPALNKSLAMQFFKMYGHAFKMDGEIIFNIYELMCWHTKRVCAYIQNTSMTHMPACYIWSRMSYCSLQAMYHLGIPTTRGKKLETHTFLRTLL